MRSPRIKSPPSRPSRATRGSANRSLDDSRTHPSEFVDFHHPSEHLEFHSVPKGFSSSEHVEYAEKASGYSLDGYSPPVSPTSSAPSQHPFAMSSHRINRELMNTVPDFQNLARDARRATNTEHTMTFMQAVRMYPKAIGWSILLSLTIVMEGFDITLVNC